MKRLFDLVLALAMLIVLGPIMLIVAVIIRLDSTGPALFRQIRVGQHQKPYTIYKFRTMRTDTADLPSHEVGRSAITKVGNFLRKTKLDELPQLINVVKGEMSFVGPRPCLPTQTELVNLRAAAGIFDLVPGITGAAQIAGIAMDRPAAMVEVETEYREKASLGSDLGIVVKTFTGAGQGDQAG